MIPAEENLKLLLADLEKAGIQNFLIPKQKNLTRSNHTAIRQ